MPFNWQNIIDNMSVALMAADDQGVIVAVNTSAEDLFLVSRRFFVGKKIVDVFQHQKKLINVIERSSNTNARYTAREIEFNEYANFQADVEQIDSASLLKNHGTLSSSKVIV